MINGLCAAEWFKNGNNNNIWLPNDQPTICPLHNLNWPYQMTLLVPVNDQ